MYRYPFAVRDDVFCVWDQDLPQRNERFLKSFDPGFLDYAVNVHLPQLEGENQARAAVALRTASHHGLETLFSLLGAATQAPDCVAAWIPKCGNTALRALVEDISAGREVLTQLGRQPITWLKLSSTVLQNAWPKDEPPGSTAGRFADLWQRLARDFVSQPHIDEYNSIKHGFRISSGGMSLRVGLEPSYGVSPPEDQMQWVGHSPHGTGFYSPERMDGAPDNRKFHFRLRDRHLNWRAEAMVQLAQLIGWSIDNVVSFLRVVAGAAPGTVQFHRPEDPAAFDAPWAWSVGVTETSMDFVIDVPEAQLIDRGSLLAELTAATKKPGGPVG